MDIWLQRPEGVMEKIEVKGSRRVKMSHLLQSILYHDDGDKIAVAALNETLEPTDWFIDEAKRMVGELGQFVQDYPEEASKIYNPSEEVCPSCNRTECPARFTLK